MSDSNLSIGKALSTSTTFVEKSIEFRHFMLLISFILTLDSSLVIFYKKGLLNAFSSFDAPEVSAGNALVFLGLFGFLMTVLFPALRQILLMVPKYVSLKWPKQHEHDYNLGWPSLIRKKAIIERDKVALEILDKHEAVQHENRTNMNIGFAMVVLFALNFLVLGDDQTLSLSQTSATLLEAKTGFWLTALIRLSLGGFLIFSAFITFFSLTPENDSKIYWPESPEERDKRVADEARRLGV